MHSGAQMCQRRVELGQGQMGLGDAKAGAMMQEENNGAGNEAMGA